jgi:methionyl-tRNA formyltransferase
VHLAAQALVVEVRTPTSLKGTDEQEAFRALGADVAVVVAYGLLLPKAILEGTRLGCYNGHASLLPRWRGAAPIQRAIMAGDAQTGMMVMKMDAGLDTGPVALTETVEIEPDMTGGELHDRLSAAGAPLMVDAMARLERGALPLTPQPDAGVTYAKKIDKGETRIDWTRPAADVHNTIRALSPFPGAWCEIDVSGKPERLKVLRTTRTEGAGQPGEILDAALTIACGNSAVRLVEVQRAGGKPMGATEFLRGVQLGQGEVLS